MHRTSRRKRARYAARAYAAMQGEVPRILGANIAVPTGGTVGAITAALAINGEPLSSATATVTPAAVENYFNIFVSTFVEVPRGCCLTVAAKNTSAQAVSFANSNMIVERVS